MGGAQRTVGSSLCAMIKNFYHGILKAVHTSSLGLGEPQFKTRLYTAPARTFYTPLGTIRLDAPALFRVRNPNDGNTLG